MSRHGDPDAQVDEFLELEQELSAGAKTGKTYDEGNVAEVAKIPASEVPDDYPVPIRTRQALQLNVETPDGQTVATYLEWLDEDGEESDHLERLLDALDRSHDEFANIYGDRVALDSENGWHGIDPEKTVAMRGAQVAANDQSLDASRVLLAGSLVGEAIGFIAINTVSAGVGALLVFASLFAVPVFFYRDAKKVSEISNWDAELSHLIGMAVPIFNVGVGFAYLVTRHLRLSEALPGEDSNVLLTAYAVGGVAFLFGFAANDLVTNVATPTLLYAMVFLPFLVYFDSGYVRELTDWKPNRGAWCLFAGLTVIVGTGVYLLKRRGELG